MALNFKTEIQEVTVNRKGHVSTKHERVYNIFKREKFPDLVQAYYKISAYGKIGKNARTEAMDLMLDANAKALEDALTHILGQLIDKFGEKEPTEQETEAEPETELED